MVWRVKFWDPPKAFEAMETEVMATIRDVLAHGNLVLRQELEDFERDLAAFVGTNHAVGVSNCTDGLQMILEAAGIGPGDEVITVAHTFVATLAAIHWVGADPVLVDVGPDHNMDPEAVETAVTERTRAIIPVHLNGRLCEMDRIQAIAEKHSLLVIEDTAQALGATFDGKAGGAWGAAGAFSFYPAKLLGAYGDAGAVVTSDLALSQQISALRDHGRTSKTEISGWGHNSRLDNLQAAILSLKLKSVPNWISRRRHLATMYDESLKPVEGVQRPPAPDTGRFFDIYQNYVVEAERRDGLHEYLARKGIETMISWPVPTHHQPIGLTRFDLPRTEALSEHVLSLPLHTDLLDSQVEQVIAAIDDFYQSPG